ncbi:MAG: hypothetical protein LBF97_01630 [Elusimicrobiota bacterium]|jgi:hypothetical protein|nr:hypothetical protein [Elusimicrobiota bacterium]
MKQKQIKKAKTQRLLRIYIQDGEILVGSYPAKLEKIPVERRKELVKDVMSALNFEDIDFRQLVENYLK